MDALGFFSFSILGSRGFCSSGRPLVQTPQVLDLIPHLLQTFLRGDGLRAERHCKRKSSRRQKGGIFTPNVNMLNVAGFIRMAKHLYISTSPGSIVSGRLLAGHGRMLHAVFLCTVSPEKQRSEGNPVQFLLIFRLLIRLLVCYQPQTVHPARAATTSTDQICICKSLQLT